jgi:hypothetical protein
MHTHAAEEQQNSTKQQQYFNVIRGCQRSRTKEKQAAAAPDDVHPRRSKSLQSIFMKSEANPGAIQMNHTPVIAAMLGW